MKKKVIGVMLAAGTASVVAGIVYDWWQECRFELFDPEWIRRSACACAADGVDVWCPDHGDPELGSLVADA